jgi:tetratricopeptide (TPR) repeat protein
MATPESAALEELKRVLESPGFAQNERQSRFLRFLVERQLDGRGSELKESLIGIEVFGRRPDYNPKRDAIVRTEAGRLRARLTEYYTNTGKRDALVIEVPKGSYVPVIRPAAPAPDPLPSSRWRLRASVAGLGILLIILGLALLRTYRREVHVTAARTASSLPPILAAAHAPRGIANSQRLRHYEAGPAFAVYLKARTGYRPGREIPNGNVDAYQEAIAKDPTFAPAYAGLATAYAFGSSRPIGDRTNGLVKMRTAAERAVQLDPLLPEAYDAMGIVYARLGLWEKAERSFDHAINLDPNAPVSRLDFAMSFLVPTGWISSALQQIRLAEKSDPLSPDVQDAFAYTLISAGQFEKAEEHCRKSEIFPECLGRIRIGQGRIAEAIEILTSVNNTRYLGYALGRAGRRKEAEELAAISPGALQQVLIYAGLGDKDRTFEALDHMVEFGPIRVGRTLAFPELALLRGDPRVKALRQKVGLPE